MKKVLVSLNSIEKVKTFVKDIDQFECECDLISGRYVIDAKSMLGIFSLDLSRPIELSIHADNEEADRVIHALSSYLIS